jgi:hypothetical protein
MRIPGERQAPGFSESTAEAPRRSAGPRLSRNTADVMRIGRNSHPPCLSQTATSRNSHQNTVNSHHHSRSSHHLGPDSHQNTGLHEVTDCLSHHIDLDSHHHSDVLMRIGVAMMRIAGDSQQKTRFSHQIGLSSRQRSSIGLPEVASAEDVARLDLTKVCAVQYSPGNTL